MLSHSFCASRGQKWLSWVALTHALMAHSMQRSVMRLKSWCQPGMLSSEGLIGAGGPTSKTVHSHGCWQEASVPRYTDLSSHRAAWASSQHGSIWFPPEWVIWEGEWDTMLCFLWPSLQSYTLSPPPQSVRSHQIHPQQGREIKPCLLKNGISRIHGPILKPHNIISESQSPCALKLTLLWRAILSLLPIC